jgi:hypothetical protein
MQRFQLDRLLYCDCGRSATKVNFTPCACNTTAATVIAGMRADAQGLVQALAAEAGVLGNLCHAASLGHIAECGRKYVGIRVFGSGREAARVAETGGESSIGKGHLGSIPYLLYTDAIRIKRLR